MIVILFLYDFNCCPMIGLDWGVWWTVLTSSWMVLNDQPANHLQQVSDVDLTSLRSLFRFCHFNSSVILALQSRIPIVLKTSRLVIPPGSVTFLQQLLSSTWPGRWLCSDQPASSCGKLRRALSGFGSQLPSTSMFLRLGVPSGGSLELYLDGTRASTWLMWFKHCHKPSMTGNGNFLPPIGDLEDGLRLF